MPMFQAVDRVREGLDYHLARHNLLVANLAHLDTPGFQPLDLERGASASFKGALNVALRGTDPRHMAPDASAPHFKVHAAPVEGSGSDGNGVSLDKEAVKIATNHVRYEVLSTIVGAQLSSLEYAASDARHA